MNFKELIGLEVEQAGRLLRSQNVHFKLTFYQGKKPVEFDKQLVVSVRESDDCLEVVIANFLFACKQ